MDTLLAWIDTLPAWLVYAGLGAGAAIENVIPAVPADTFVVVGGFLAALGDLQAGWVFAVTWTCNVASALAMYHVGHTRGRRFFDVGWGRHVLTSRQMERVGVFYDRFGTTAIFFTRFLPGLRAVVPVFAGVTHQRLLPVALPIPPPPMMVPSVCCRLVVCVSFAETPTAMAPWTPMIPTSLPTTCTFSALLR